MGGGEKEMNVLVVDDDREIVDSISIFLSGEGYKAIKAYDGIEAMDALSENEVHLMILDIMMPLVFRKSIQRLNAIVGLDSLVSFARKENTDAVNDLSIIVYNQHIHFFLTSAHIVQYNS